MIKCSNKAETASIGLRWLAVIAAVIAVLVGTGVPYGDIVSVKRLDANTVQSTIKKGGQVTMTVTSKVSADGKTRTSTFKGKDAQGRDVNNVVVYDKQ